MKKKNVVAAIAGAKLAGPLHLGLWLTAYFLVFIPAVILLKRILRIL